MKILAAFRELLAKGVTRARAIDMAKRAGHTFWQAFIAVIGVTWAASGLDVSQIVDVASGERFAVAALTAAGAAALSAFKTTLLAIMNDPADYIGEHEETAPAAPVPTSSPTPTSTGGSISNPGWTTPPSAGQ